MGLGKFLLSEVKVYARARGTKVIRETIEKDCEWPKKEKEFENILAWYQHRWFLLSEDDENFILTLNIDS